MAKEKRLVVRTTESKLQEYHQQAKGAGFSNTSEYVDHLFRQAKKSS